MFLFSLLLVKTCEGASLVSELSVSDEDREELIERLEALDDIIFPAIDGDQTALEAAPSAWQETVTILGSESDAVRESRREYLRHARATWEFLRNQAVQRPHHILAVVKIISMLLGDDTG
jgi:hypothetical protein